MALGFLASAGFGQNVCKDYLKNVPRQYGPQDPWQVGFVMRNQMGFGGLFYNCDCEEEKRYSPYIDWRCQPMVQCPRGIWAISRQQVAEVRNRVAVGACQCANFNVSSPCRSCTTYVPLQSPAYPWQPDLAQFRKSSQTHRSSPSKSGVLVDGNHVDTKKSAWLMDLYR